MTARAPRTLSTLTTLALVSALAALVLTGCNRPLPTEPEDNFSSFPQYDAPQASSTGTSTSSSTTSASASSTTDATSIGGRRRPARTTSTPVSSPNTPATTTTPPTPMISDCDGLCDNILHIPSQGDVDAAIMAARDRVRDAVARGELKAGRKVSDWNVKPNVEWKACYFFVGNGYYYDANGNRQVGACAAGMTDYKAKKIVVSTKNQARTIALVKWEATNYYLALIGRDDLSDRWQ